MGLVPQDTPSVREERRTRGMVIEMSQLVSERRQLAGPHGPWLWEGLRLAIIRALADRTGLPFALAITAIERWEESERDWVSGWETLRARPPEERPVLITARCHIRTIQPGEG